MDETLLTVLLAATSVGLLVWGLGAAVEDAVTSEKKKLQQRLSSENQVVAEPAFAKAIRRRVELGGMSGLLLRLPGLAGVHHALEQTWPAVSLARFLSVAGGMALGGFVLSGAFFGSLLLAVVGASFGGVPFLILSNRRERRQRQLAEQLPETLDFLGRILRAGHSLTTGLQMVGEELPDPLADEFRRAYSAHSLGRTLDDALKEASLRVGSTDFGFFVTAVLIQRQTGGDLSEVLDNISEMIRGRLRLQQHVKAKTAEGRFTGYILAAFPAAMFILTYSLNPTYASVLLHGTGLYLLITAGAMSLIGLLLIRRITAVKV
ncbi:MAG: type II secretion system F family protein [Tepidisphaeraceae bacterium]|jgi:tight adherence protein B